MTCACFLLPRHCWKVVVWPEIDCLISDVGMPVMDGFELVRVVQAARPGLPIILVTGRPDLLSRSPLDRQVTTVCSRSRSRGRNFSRLSAMLCGALTCAHPGRDNTNINQDTRAPEQCHRFVRESEIHGVTPE